ncbi:MarR family winged helix-turn-helix transcriptional regulator [Rapidithrix thailandica]|uniref:MarR family winged helix-turn-helix transcriptional regulator n=1 Tax=Rapidithrix thailandica TaxID=413964 RepID=A0AAW9SM19_9BACT
MKESVFNTQFQQTDTPSKIVAGLERISEAFRVLLWAHAKTIGLSPIQIQLLIFITYHPESLCNVSHLAKEFNVSKPTISDVVKVLEKKALIEKHKTAFDQRSYSIALTSEGQAVVKDTEQFANPIRQQIEKMDKPEQIQLFSALNKVIFSLNQSGILSVQRTCYGCKFYQKNETNHFCNLIKKELLDKDIRIDCPEYEGKAKV